jgi:molybdopterin synthase catalytic subunit
MPEVRLFPDRLDPYDELTTYECDLIAEYGAGQYGATVSFVGSMRDFNEGEEVSEMFLEHYPGMTEKVLEKLCAQAMTDYPILDCLVLHRVGEILPNDPIVLVAAWSAHRGAAFDATRFLIEKLKTDAPFWKKESLASGDRWVEKNTKG